MTRASRECRACGLVVRADGDTDLGTAYDRHRRNCDERPGVPPK